MAAQDWRSAHTSGIGYIDSGRFKDTLYRIRYVYWSHRAFAYDGLPTSFQTNPLQTVEMLPTRTECLCRGSGLCMCELSDSSFA
jgi:hypothetical protein